MSVTVLLDVLSKPESIDEPSKMLSVSLSAGCFDNQDIYYYRWLF